MSKLPCLFTALKSSVSIRREVHMTRKSVVLSRKTQLATGKEDFPSPWVFFMRQSSLTASMDWLIKEMSFVFLTYFPSGKSIFRSHRVLWIVIWREWMKNSSLSYPCVLLSWCPSMIIIYFCQEDIQWINASLSKRDQLCTLCKWGALASSEHATMLHECWLDFSLVKE